MTNILDTGGLLTTNELARSLCVSRMTICRAVASGKLKPAAKLPGVNGAYLFPPAALDEWGGPRLHEVDGHLVWGVPAS